MFFIPLKRFFIYLLCRFPMSGSLLPPSTSCGRPGSCLGRWTSKWTTTAKWTISKFAQKYSSLWGSTGSLKYWTSSSIGPPEIPMSRWAAKSFSTSPISSTCFKAFFHWIYSTLTGHSSSRIVSRTRVGTLIQYISSTSSIELFSSMSRRLYRPKQTAFVFISNSQN